MSSFQVLLHEIILPVLTPVLVAGLFHVPVGKQVIICVVLAVLDLLPLLGDTGILLLARELAGLHTLAQLSLPVFPLLPQIRVLLNLGFVEPVDNDIFPLRYKNTLDLNLGE